MPPLGALIVGLFAVAVPAIILMSVWAGVTALRLLFPEEPLPFDPASRRRRATLKGEFVPVRLRDILEDQQARQSVAARMARERDAAGEHPLTDGHPLADDLWLRRN